MKVVAIVGMTGAGKTEAARLFENEGFTRIRFGDVTDEEVRKQGLKLNEENERQVREALRKKYGMAAYAMLNLSRIDLALKQAPVVVDGLYSWDEYIFLRNYYWRRFYVVAVWASPETRYARLSHRGQRPLTEDEAASRDMAEIEEIKKSGPIAMADFTILNESTLDSLKKEVKKTIAVVRRKD
ncbi:MAG TPA: AAA family ATPase [Dehalococcoidia bacterium]|nr:AAA family ATPase [Dehalococcoidia bacterium]